MINACLNPEVEEACGRHAASDEVLNVRGAVGAPLKNEIGDVGVDTRDAVLKTLGIGDSNVEGLKRVDDIETASDLVIVPQSLDVSGVGIRRHRCDVAAHVFEGGEVDVLVASARRRGECHRRIPVMARMQEVGNDA